MEEGVGLENCVEHYRQYAGLPIVAMDDIGVEVNDRQDRQCGLGEIAKLLDIPVNITVGLGVGEIVLIIDKVVGNAIQLVGHNADIDIAQPAEIHIEMMYILELIAVFFRNARVIRQYDAHVVLVLVERFGQCARDIGKAAGLDERYAFRRNK